jgi:Spy/CpxP family protein refolding chaperone
LNLTEEQEKKLKETQATYGKEAMKKKHDAMEKAQDELSEALKSDATDEKIREKFAALHKIQEDFATVRFEKILYIRSILTPEQRTKFKELIGK